MFVFGLAACASAQIRVSQVYTWGGLDPAGYDRDYIELYNAGSSEVSVSGLSLDLHNAATGDWVAECPLSGSIPPKGRYLVAVGAAGVGRALPTPDAEAVAYTLVHTQPCLVVLWQFSNDAWSTLDYVGVGNGSVAEGGNPAPASSNALEATLRANPDADSNNNGADFIVGAADPRSASPGAPMVSAIGAQRINEGGSTGELAFLLEDPDTPVDTLSVSADSSNTELVPNSGQGLALGGAGAERTITVTPIPGASGKTTISITVSDGQFTTSVSFQLTVNGRPTIAALPDISVVAGTSVPPIDLEVGDAEISGQAVIRVMAANTTSGSGQSYEEAGDRIFQGLRPDVALVQEFNVSTYPSIRAWVDANFGSDFHYYREPVQGIPNGIVSRWPILTAGSWDDPEMTNREFTWARIDVPGEKELWAISVHFNAGSSDAASRARQGASLASYIANNVPESDYVLVGGDLNTFSRTESAVMNLAGLLVTGSPWPTDESGNPYTNAGRSSPYDWVLAEPELDVLETPLEIGTLSFSDGLVFDSRRFSQLSAVFPVQQQDSGVQGMQHMAVLREFTLPAPADLVVTVSSSNQTLVQDADIVIYGSGAKRTIRMKPQANAVGTATITVAASDGELSATDQFQLRVDERSFGAWITTTKVPADRHGMSDRNGPAALANLVAYAMGIDPMDAGPNDLPRVASIEGAAQELSFLYRRAKSRPGGALVVETSSDLANWSPAEVRLEQVSSISESLEEVTALVALPQGDACFLRLKATERK